MYVIAWDFALVFAGDPEFLPLYELGWRTQPVPRLHFGSTTSIRFSPAGFFCTSVRGWETGTGLDRRRSPVRQRDREGGPALARALHAHGAAVGLGDSVHQGQSEPPA